MRTRNADHDKNITTHEFFDILGNLWSIKITEDVHRHYRLSSFCNGNKLGHALYFSGKNQCYEYLDKLFKKNLF